MSTSISCAKAHAARPASKAAAVAATSPPPKRLRRLRPGRRPQRRCEAGSAASTWWRRGCAGVGQLLRGLLGGLLAGGTAATAATLPENKAEAIYHVYDGGGVKATGPALLVRKSLADRVSLSAQYYIDAVSNASIDVVTTASPFKETRKAYDFGADLLVRDSLLTLSVSRSDEPDYIAQAVNADVSHEVFGGMTTVSLGFTRARDQVGKKGELGWIDQARHWQYRAGVTQILTPRWLVSLNAEAVADSGFLGSPYRAARVFGAAVPERNPRTRSSRAVKLRTLYDSGSLLAGSSVRAEFRRYWDNWDILATTTEFGFAKRLGESFLLDASLRFYAQDKALFYSDNAQVETVYVSRNRQLSTFKSTSFSARLSYTWPRLPPGWDVKLMGAYERKSFRFDDFTDLRTGSNYGYDANVLQLMVLATF
ncbi:MAG: hypothetical protein C0505_03205 [Leptothrix sp. (in: Bacteria)]|nr:hypothetical protein [Leptothrix sp. (in: b-proteobacteria)]